MLGLLAPLVSLVVVSSRPVVPSADPVMSPRIAQLKLAETLASADSIEWVRASGVGNHTITFAITRHERAYRVTAGTDALDNVVSLTVNPSDTSVETGNLGWIASELASARGVTQLAADADGAVLIVTSDDRRYLAIPGRGSGGGVNAAVEARWAATWNTDKRG